MANYQLSKTGAEIDDALSKAIQHETSKANVDGAYEGLTAGNAEQLVSSVGVKDKVPYNFRTAGGSADIGNRLKDKIVGGTLAWNQLVQNGNFASDVAWISANATATFANNIATFIASAVTGQIAQANIPFIAGHRYLITAQIKTTTATNKIRLNTYKNSSPYDSVNKWCESTTNWQTINNIVTPEYSTGYFVRIVDDRTADWDEVQVKNVMIFDLTKMFRSAIADYIAFLEGGEAGAGVAWFKKLFPKSYYAYNAGKLESVKVSAHNTIGFNQFDLLGWLDSLGVSDITQVDVQTYLNSKVVWDNRALRYQGRVCFYQNGITVASGTPAVSIRFEYTDGTHKDTTLGVNGYAVSDSGKLVSYIRTVYGAGGKYNFSNAKVCVNLSWDGERDGEYEAYVKNQYPLDDSLELRGIPKIDANGDLYYDGDEYEASGKVTRNYEYRAYEDGDENLDNAITDGTHTVVKLATPTEESADPFADPQIDDDFGTEEYVDYAEAAGDRDVAIPVGHDTFYQNNLRAKLEMSPNSPDGDGDYIVRQNDGINEYVPLIIPAELPTAPSSDGTYHLKLIVADGTATLSWEGDQ